MKRTRARFLATLEGEDFDAARDAFPGVVIVVTGIPGYASLRIFPYTPGAQPMPGSGHIPTDFWGDGESLMEALRCAAWSWLDARKGIYPAPVRPS